MEKYKTERELEFLKIKKQDTGIIFKHYVDSYKHSAIYLLALVVGFVGILFSLGYTKNIFLIVMIGLVMLGCSFVRMWINCNEMNKLVKKINNSMDKRFEKLGVNVKAIEKGVGLNN